MSAGGSTVWQYRFRDQLIAASLKRDMQRDQFAVDHSFPRSADRGLIEAALDAVVDAATASGFRDQLIAASLKPHDSNVASHY